VRYVDDAGKERTYYPDFYLPEFELIVEIKPSSMLYYGTNPLKLNAASLRCAASNFAVVTEEDLFLLHEHWIADLEYLRA